MRGDIPDIKGVPACVEEKISIDNKELDVAQIMIFSEQWLVKNFILPIKAEAWRLTENIPDVRASSPREVSPRGSFREDVVSRTGLPKWVPDDEFSYCQGCYTSFTVFNRRHHCRACGRLMCQKCSKYKRNLQKLGVNKKVRVCKTCVTVS